MRLDDMVQHDGVFPAAGFMFPEFDALISRACDNPFPEHVAAVDCILVDLHERDVGGFALFPSAFELFSFFIDGKPIKQYVRGDIDQL